MHSLALTAYHVADQFKAVLDALAQGQDRVVDSASNQRRWTEMQAGVSPSASTDQVTHDAAQGAALADPPLPSAAPPSAHTDSGTQSLPAAIPPSATQAGSMAISSGAAAFTSLAEEQALIIQKMQNRNA